MYSRILWIYLKIIYQIFKKKYIYKYLGNIKFFNYYFIYNYNNIFLHFSIFLIFDIVYNYYHIKIFINVCENLK